MEESNAGRGKDERRMGKERKERESGGKEGEEKMVRGRGGRGRKSE